LLPAPQKVQSGSKNRAAAPTALRTQGGVVPAAVAAALTAALEVGIAAPAAAAAAAAVAAVAVAVAAAPTAPPAAAAAGTTTLPLHASRPASPSCRCAPTIACEREVNGTGNGNHLHLLLLLVLSCPSPGPCVDSDICAALCTLASPRVVRCDALLARATLHDGGRRAPPLASHPSRPTCCGFGGRRRQPRTAHAARLPPVGVPGGRDWRAAGSWLPEEVVHRRTTCSRAVVIPMPED